jgi:sulfoxide reductase heme-binding subunit YedZ
MIAAAPSPLWYLSRGTGAITLVLLSATVVLGIGGTIRWRRGPHVPRFLVDGLHRNLSLLVVVLLAAHVLTSLLDPFAHLHVLDAVVPLASSYRPLWLGFGALALDLLIAVTVTSVLRARLGFRAWRRVHWAAYACWPVAVLHGLGTGTDASARWLQALTAVSVVAVAGALATRLLRGWPARAALRAGALGGLAAALAGGAAFAVAGPLSPGWARRSGTPATLLAAARPVAAPAGRTAAPAATAAGAQFPFTAPLQGRARQLSTAGDGGTEIDILAKVAVSGGPLDLDLRLYGQALPGGGLQMSSSRVTLRPHGANRAYRGRVVALNGSRLEARLVSAGARPVRLRMALRIDAGGTVAGTAGAQELVG